MYRVNINFHICPYTYDIENEKINFYICSYIYNIENGKINFCISNVSIYSI